MNIAVILCGGTGSRMNQELPKQFIKINNKPLFGYAVETFLNANNIDRVLLVINQKYEDLYQDYINKFNEGKLELVYGGSTRQESVEKAISFLEDKVSKDDIILLHDAARPLLNQEIIDANISKCLETKEPVLTYIKIVDTMMDKKLNLLNRDNLIAAQTPQTFLFGQLKAIHEFANASNIKSASDDIQLAKMYGLNISLVMGSRKNVKVTETEDLELIKLYLRVGD